MKNALWLSTALFVCAGSALAGEAGNLTYSSDGAPQSFLSANAAVQPNFDKTAQYYGGPTVMPMGGSYGATSGTYGGYGMAGYGTGYGYAAGYGYPTYGYGSYGYPAAGYGMMQQGGMVAPQVATPQIVGVTPVQTSQPAPEPQPAPQPVAVQEPPMQPRAVNPVPVQTREIIRVRTQKVPDRFKTYIGVTGSAPFYEPFDYAVLGPTVDRNSYLGKDDPNGVGYTVHGVIGVECCNMRSIGKSNLRFEGEVGYAHLGTSDFDFVYSDGVTTVAGDADASLKSWTAAMNMYVDYHATPQIKPYVGIGVGGALSMLDIHDTGIDDMNRTNIDTRDTTYLGQAMLGANVAINNNLDFNLGYRFRRFGELGDLDLGDAAYWRVKREQSHSLDAGVRIKF